MLAFIKHFITTQIHKNMANIHHFLPVVSSFCWPFVKILGDGRDSGGDNGVSGKSSDTIGCGRLSKL